MLFIRALSKFKFSGCLCFYPPTYWSKIVNAIRMNCNVLFVSGAALLMSLIYSNITFADGNLPVAPMEPTMQDCRKLNQDYWIALCELNDMMRNCMSERPIFGWGTSVIRI